MQNRQVLTPAFVLSLVGVIFAAGVAYADMRRVDIIDELRRDVATLESDRRRLDIERELMNVRLIRLEAAPRATN